MSYSDFVSAYAGTVNDKTMALLADNGAPDGSLYDRWKKFLDLQAVPEGAHQDRIRSFLLSYTGAADVGQSVCDLWNTVDGPFTAGSESPELIINGTFDDGTTGYTSGNSGILTVTDGIAKLEKGGSSAPYFYQAVNLEAGKTYRILVEVVESFYISSIRLGDGPAQLTYLNSGATGPRIFSHDYTPTETKLLYISVVYSGEGIQIGDYGRYDNFSVKELVA